MNSTRPDGEPDALTDGGYDLQARGSGRGRRLNFQTYMIANIMLIEVSDGI